jgi:hypothetical protein
MTIRTKTIEYAFALSTTSLASATARNFTQLAALAIPETTSRTFRAVTLEMSAVDNGTTAVSLTDVLMGIALAAVAISTTTVTETIAASGENTAWIFQRDVTSYFVTNYTGTSMTADCRLTITGPISSNATAKLIITYDYDDGATTQIKTVKIPMDGNTGDLTTGFTNLGGVASQIPALDTFLPEASKTYRDVFFEMDIHTGTTAAASQVLTMRYDGATSISDVTHAHTLVTDVHRRRTDKLLSAFTTNATHSIEALTTSTTGAPYPCLNGVLVVTYEFNASTSTSIINSVQLGISEEGLPGATVTGDKSRLELVISVQEPTTIALVQSGVQSHYVDDAAVTLDVRCGGQASRTFVHPATVRGGGLSSMRRFDSGAAGGAGMTLARGFNTLTIDHFVSVSGIGANMNHTVYLNYTSGKDAGGVGIHNHTVHWGIAPWSTGNLLNSKTVVPTITPIIPETTYWINWVSHHIFQQTSNNTGDFLGIHLKCEIQSGEAEAAGFRSLFTGLYTSDAERGTSHTYAGGNKIFKRWPDDPDTRRLDIETARDYRFETVNLSSMWMASVLVTYHNITQAIAGDITGSSAGTVTIKAHLAADTGGIPKGTEIANTSRSGNGAYSMTWYDDTVNVFVQARESATRIGRSDDAVAA